MLTFQVNDMSCGRCVNALTQAVKATDEGAAVSVDLAQRLLHVQPAHAGAQELAKAIADAGYTPVLVERRAAATEAPRAGGCCCGSGGGRCG